MAAEKVSITLSYDKPIIKHGDELRVTVSRSGWDPLAPWLYRTLYLIPKIDGLGTIPPSAIESVSFSSPPISQYNPNRLSGDYWVTGNDYALRILFWQGETTKTFTIKFSSDLDLDNVEAKGYFHVVDPSSSTYAFDLSKTYSTFSLTDLVSNPAVPAYSLVTSTASVNEGGTLTTTISSTGVASGTTLYYGLSGTGITIADFTSGAITGQVTVDNNGSASFSHTLATDLTTEGAETLEINLFSDSARTLQVGNTTTISVGDTSTTPRTNNTPTGTPALSGTFKAGQVVTIDSTPIQDTDNFTGYTPTYNYAFEVSNDNGATWTKLTSTDATDNNTTYTLSTAEVGKQVRGVVSYMDGYGTNEVVPTSGSSVVSAPVVRGNSLYTIVDGPSWTEAEANSVKLGGHLVTINDASENQFITDFRFPNKDYSWGTWIGLNDSVDEGNWQWTSGSKHTYRNWRSGEPNDADYLGRGDDFVVIEPTGAWTDLHNTRLADAPHKATGIAETTFIRRGDSAYVIVQGPTWEEAEANAVKLGGQLVTINDAVEQTFLDSWSPDEQLWTGLTDREEEGVWKWISGESLSYTNWNPEAVSGFPYNTQYTIEKSNGAYPEGEDYVLIYAKSSTHSRQWDDGVGRHDHGTWLNKGIAEIKLAPNNAPTGTPTLSGTLKAGQVITIDRTPLQDADNFTGYTPTYNYSFEASSNGATWTKLTSTDATDNNSTYTLTSAEVGKKIRGVVSYLDGYGTNEVVPTAGSSVTSAAVVRGNSLYTIVDGPSWTQAEANSVKLGGHLVTINDAAENEWVANLTPQQTWIGFTDAETEGNWKWVDGSSSTYTNWYLLGSLGAEPNNGSYNQRWEEPYVRGEDYAFLYKTSDTNKWGDGYGQHDHGDWLNKGISETPFIRRGDSAYVIVQGPTWEEAEANAVKLGGHLVTINDAAENEWLHTIYNISNGFNNTALYLTGYTDKDKEGDWKWISGDQSSYVNWDQYGPSNNDNGNAENFMHLGWFSDKQWNDIPSSWRHSNYTLGIAEIKLAPNNVPTGFPLLSGTSKVGSTLTIDTSSINDTDNFYGYTPTYNYSFEVSNDNGTNWTKLTSTDATDNNTTYTLTTTEVGKKVRGVVSYLDGYGTNEVVPTVGSASVTDPSPTYTLTPSSTSVNEGSTISYTLSTSNVASGTSLYYQFSGTGVNAADFSSATTTGSESVGSNGQMTISRTLTADKITEGNESLILKVFTDSAATTPLATNSAVTVIDTSLTPSTPTQKVYTDKSEISYKPTGVAALPLLYTTSNNDANLSGLTLNVHYNSSILTPSGANNGVSGQVAAAITKVKVLPDTSNSDGDPLTDKIVQLLWATFDNSFPNKTLPTAIATVSFETSATKKDPVTGQSLSTNVRYTSSETAAGYDFLTGSTTFKAQQFNLDVDGDGKVTALGDGLMVIRKLFGTAFSGDELTYKAISPNATRTTAEIHDFIQEGIDSWMLDVDKDGKTTALGDGLMVIRRLFGAAFEGSDLTNKAISPGSPYFGPPADFAAVAFNIDSLRPTLI